MKSVSVSKSMAELLEDLFRPGEVSKQHVKDRILARLQRKSNNLTDEQKYDVSERLGGKTIREYAKELKSCTEEAFVRRCREDKDFLLWFDNLKGKSADITIPKRKILFWKRPAAMVTRKNRRIIWTLLWPMSMRTKTVSKRSAYGLGVY